MGATTANDVTAPELDALCRRIAGRSPTMAINVYKLIRAAFRWGFATFIRLPLLCGTRRGETALAEWDEVDLREQGPSVWRVRAEHRVARQAGTAAARGVDPIQAEADARL